MKLSNHNRRESGFVDAIQVDVHSIASVLCTARKAQQDWARTSVTARLALVRELRHLIAANAVHLAEASASARNRPAMESLTAEALPLAEACRFLEREGESLLKPRRFGWRGLPLWLAGVSSEIRREPLGVVLIIGPGNYPLLLPGVQIIQALVAGNAVLLKPGVGGTGAARALMELVQKAGFPASLLALLPESADASRAAIEALPDKVIFTGSAATGEVILKQLAPRLIPATMELSGSDAVVIRADADLDLVMKALRFGLTLNAGATCLGPKRVFVHRSLATEVEGRLESAFDSESTFQLSPIVSARVRPFIEGALRDGAHLIVGSLHNNGSILGPLVLGGAAPEHRILHEDVFAPVLSVITVANDDEAIEQANAGPFALGASVFSRDLSAAREIAERLNAGVVTINDLIVPTADARLPFGGRKRSGFGITRGAEGLLELTTPKVITVSRARSRPAFEPPHPKDAAMLKAYFELAHGRGIYPRGRALFALLRSLSGRKKQSRNPVI